MYCIPIASRPIGIACIFIKCKNVKCVKIDIICNVQYIYLTLKVVVRCLINIITKLASCLLIQLSTSCIYDFLLDCISKEADLCLYSSAQ